MERVDECVEELVMFMSLDEGDGNVRRIRVGNVCELTCVP